MSYSNSDLNHLLDLLALMPWASGSEESLEVPEQLRRSEVLGQHRWDMLNNSTLDLAPLMLGSEDPSLVFRMSMYALEAFDRLPAAASTELGTLIGPQIGVHALPEAIGQRWCDDLTATAWRILADYVGAERRADLTDQPADMTPRA